MTTQIKKWITNTLHNKLHTDNTTNYNTNTKPNTTQITKPISTHITKTRKPMQYQQNTIHNNYKHNTTAL